MKRFYALFFIILLLSCGVKQPVEPETEQQFGYIIVLSEPAGALIYVDGQNTSLRTPDTLKQQPGLYSIQTFLPEYDVTPDSISVQVVANATQTINFSMQKIETSGAVYVTSTPPGADIFVDNQPSGKVTPDTLQFESGDYTVDVRKNGYITISNQISILPDTTLTFETALDIQPCILLEAFGNVSCTPCVEAARNLETFVNFHPTNDYVILEYYANWPSPNDPFYKEAPNDVMQRVMYYQLASLPSMFIGGLYGVDATQYENINQTFATALDTWESPAGLSITKKNVNGQLSVDVDIFQKRVLSNVQNLRLFVAILENDIQFESPPGSNGLTHFNFVFRGFLSDKSGDPLVDDTTYNYSYIKEWPDWNYSNSHIVAFIQNIETKQIIHTTLN